jgi:hypothetical protein
MQQINQVWDFDSNFTDGWKSRETRHSLHATAKPPHPCHMPVARTSQGGIATPSNRQVMEMITT